MEEDYLRSLKEGNWGYESETSSFTHSDIRYPWEDEVNSQGELFYVMHYPFAKDIHEQNQDNVLVNNDTNDKTNQGILGRLMRRRSSRRSLRRKDDKGSSKHESELSTSPDDFRRPSTSRKDVYDGELEPVNIYMKIDFPNMKIIGRRATAVETFLGLKVMHCGTQIIINDVIPNSPAYFIQSAFRKGDWLHSINGILMTPENIENYLRNISFSKEVKEVVLTVQRVKSAVKSEPTTSPVLEQEDYTIEGFAILFIRLGRSSDGVSSEDIVFSYPTEENVIVPVRGAFLTLLHLLPSLAANQPISSSLTIKDQLINVLYTKKDDGVMLLAMPDSRISLEELYWVNNDVVRCLLFTFQTLSRGFSTERNLNSLNKFFHALFKRVIHRQTDCSEIHYEFESLLPAASSLPVSHEVYAQVDDALNELEANDIAEYEEQRLFNIVGSCYFYKGYNVCSHFGKEDLLDITSLCRQSDILGFMRGGVSDLVFWKEVFPASMNRGNTHIHAPYSLLPGKWFLLIVAKDHNFLFVLLESGGYTLRPVQKPGPDVFYVEEALATLKHIMKIGIPYTVNKLIKQTADEPVPKSVPNYSSNSAEHSLLSSSLSESTLNKQHSLSFRSLDSSHLARSRSNINVLAASGYDSLSSDDCVPVIGRRAERELAMETLSRASDISDDSDWNKEFKSSNRGHNTDSQDMEHSIPAKITAGKKDVMLHYVHLDKASGILISSVNNSKDCSSLLNNFRLYAHKIRRILKNTISFKKLRAQEVSSSTINKSMVAIKEHGMLFEYDDKKLDIQTYWVVGRIFFTPHLKEVYLCYQDTCPQNMIEVAFRLALNSPF